MFVDGALTMYNNPAFQLFLMATLDAYRLGWPATESDLLLVSVGTGTSPKADDHLRPDAMNLLFNANSVPAALMHAALNEQDLLCRVFGRCRHGAPIDLEVGDLMHGEGLLESGFSAMSATTRNCRAAASTTSDFPIWSPRRCRDWTRFSTSAI